MDSKQELVYLLSGTIPTSKDKKNAPMQEQPQFKLLEGWAKRNKDGVGIINEVLSNKNTVINTGALGWVMEVTVKNPDKIKISTPNYANILIQTQSKNIQNSVVFDFLLNLLENKKSVKSTGRLNKSLTYNIIKQIDEVDGAREGKVIEMINLVRDRIYTDRKNFMNKFLNYLDDKWKEKYFEQNGLKEDAFHWNVEHLNTLLNKSMSVRFKVSSHYTEQFKSFLNAMKSSIEKEPAKWRGKIKWPYKKDSSHFYAARIGFIYSVFKDSEKRDEILSILMPEKSKLKKMINDTFIPLTKGDNNAYIQLVNYSKINTNLLSHGDEIISAISKSAIKNTLATLIFKESTPASSFSMCVNMWDEIEKQMPKIKLKKENIGVFKIPEISYVEDMKAGKRLDMFWENKGEAKNPMKIKYKQYLDNSKDLTNYLVGKLSNDARQTFEILIGLIDKKQNALHENSLAAQIKTVSKNANIKKSADMLNTYIVKENLKKSVADSDNKSNKKREIKKTRKF